MWLWGENTRKGLCSGQNYCDARSAPKPVHMARSPSRSVLELRISIAHIFSNLLESDGNWSLMADVKPYQYVEHGIQCSCSISLNSNISAISFESLEICGSTLSPINLPDLSFIRPAVRARSYSLFTKIVSLPVAYPAEL